ncbi:type 1 fimbrial protein [Escherichia sp. TW14182]|uniref:type 1 fimbrial protein n=1 Tax=Escherichia sp. TW14182 TaxID=754336 RepID=UPI0005786E37
MKKSLIAITISLFVGSSVSAIAATPASGTQIGSGTLAVTGSTGESACSVSFPTSVTVPSFSKADFNAKSTREVITSQNAGNITFTGCSGQSVNLKVTASNTISGNGYIAYPVVNGKTQGQYGVVVGLEKDSVFQYIQINRDDANFQNITVGDDNYSIPVTVSSYKMGTNSADISYGTYNVNFVFTATYA